MKDKLKEGDPGISWSTTEGMIGRNGETTVTIREYRSIKLQLKRLQKSYNNIVQKYEVRSILYRSKLGIFYLF